MVEFTKEEADIIARLSWCIGYIEGTDYPPAYHIIPKLKNILNDLLKVEVD